MRYTIPNMPCRPNNIDRKCMFPFVGSLGTGLRLSLRYSVLYVIKPLMKYSSKCVVLSIHLLVFSHNKCIIVMCNNIHTHAITYILESTIHLGYFVNKFRYHNICKMSRLS